MNPVDEYGPGLTSQYSCCVQSILSLSSAFLYFMLGLSIRVSTLFSDFFFSSLFELLKIIFQHITSPYKNDQQAKPLEFLRSLLLAMPGLLHLNLLQILLLFLTLPIVLAYHYYRTNSA